MKTKKFDANVFYSLGEKETRNEFAKKIKKTPIPDDELLENLGVFLTSKTFSRLLFFYEIYKKIVSSHGIIVEFGVRYGQTMSILSALRGIFEPFNRHRKIIGFDTFKGFIGISEFDGTLHNSKEGSYSVPPDYFTYLNDILSFQEMLNPLNHIKKYELVKGDAMVTIPIYFNKHPETLISLAIFDFDIYNPTVLALKTIKPLISKGSILIFDELCDEIFPGETIALNEILGINNYEIKRMPMTSRLSYIEIK